MKVRSKAETEETAKFVDMFDKFFDCLNVSSFTAGIQSRNAFKSPYRKDTDFRLKVGSCTCIIITTWPVIIQL